MPWYPRIHAAIQQVLPALLPTQATNLALLVSALLTKRSSCLSELARAYPRPDPEQRRVPAPKHDLLYRLKRLWRFLDNHRIDAQALQLALIPTTIAGLGHPHILGLAIDWTYFDSVLPSGCRIRYQVLRIAVPRRGRALPLLQLAYDRDDLPAGQSQNQLEEEAPLAVVHALPPTARPVVLADRGFARAVFLSWLQHHGLDCASSVPRVCLDYASTIWCALALGPAWSPRSTPAGASEQKGCALARSGERPTCATGSTTRAVRATCGSTWPCAGGCHAMYGAVALQSRRMSRGIWRPINPAPSRRLPGIANASGSRRASRTARRAFASSMSASAHRSA
jgi:hypothetical protein